MHMPNKPHARTTSKRMGKYVALSHLLEMMSSYSLTDVGCGCQLPWRWRFCSCPHIPHVHDYKDHSGDNFPCMYLARKTKNRERDLWHFAGDPLSTSARAPPELASQDFAMSRNCTAGKASGRYVRMVVKIDTVGLDVCTVFVFETIACDRNVSITRKVHMHRLALELSHLGNSPFLYLFVALQQLCVLSLFPTRLHVPRRPP